jgi:hypothetical protein
MDNKHEQNNSVREDLRKATVTYKYLGILVVGKLVDSKIVGKLVDSETELSTRNGNVRVFIDRD